MLQMLSLRRVKNWKPILSEATSSEDNHTLYFQLFLEIGIIDQLASTAFESQLPHGLTQAQFSILNHFTRLGDDKTPADLASAFQVTRGTMTSTLQKLEAKGFVSLQPSPQDGRSKRVFITDDGRSAHTDALKAAAPTLLRVNDALTDEDVRAILLTLQKLRKWLDENR